MNFLRVTLLVALCFLPRLAAAAPPLPDQPHFRDVLLGKSEEKSQGGLESLTIKAEDDTVQIRFFLKGEAESSRTAKVKRFLPQAFRLYRSRARGMGYLRMVEIPREPSGYHRFVDEQAENGVPRFYAIRAVDISGDEIELVRDLEATPLDTKRPRRPDPPLLRAEEDQIALTWPVNFEPDVQSVRIYRTDGDEYRFKRLAERTLKDGPRFVDRDVVPGRNYLYYLTTVDRAGNESIPSRERLASGRDQTPPEKPVTLQALAGDRRVVLRFPGVRSKDLAFYRMYRARGPETRKTEFIPQARIAITDLAFVEYEDKELINGQTYLYQVTSVDSVGNESLPSPVAAAVPVDQTSPDVPGRLELLSDNSLMILRFNEVEDRDGDLQGYRVYRRSAVMPAFTLLKVIPATKTRSRKKKHGKFIGIFEPIPIEYKDRGLLNGVEYTYTVTSVDRKGNESARPPAVSGSPLDREPPAVIKGLKASAGIRRVDLTFRAGRERDLRLYQVLRKEKDVRGSFEVLLEMPHDPEKKIYDCLDRRVEAGLTYLYTVEAVDESGNHSEPAPDSAATPLYPLQFSASRVYEDNQPACYLYNINPNNLNLQALRTQDYKTYQVVKGVVALPGLPPNFRDGIRINCQRIDQGVAVYCYHPGTLDLYYNATPDNQNWGGWELITAELPLPPGTSSLTTMAFEQFPDRLAAVSWDPLSRQVYHTFARDGRTFRRWRLLALNVPAPPDFSPESFFAVTSDDRETIIFSYRPEEKSLDLSFCFDRRQFRDWYRFAERVELPGIENDKRR